MLFEGGEPAVFRRVSMVPKRITDVITGPIDPGTRYEIQYNQNKLYKKNGLGILIGNHKQIICLILNAN